jgi:hypothetical protein
VIIGVEIYAISSHIIIYILTNKFEKKALVVVLVLYLTNLRGMTYLLFPYSIDFLPHGVYHCVA